MYRVPNKGNWGSIILVAVAAYPLVKYILPEQLELRGHAFTSTGVFLAIMVGLVVGTLMSIITEYYTAMGKRPVMSIVRQSSTGHATNIIGGLADRNGKYGIADPGFGSRYLRVLLFRRIIRSGYCRCRYDGNHSDAVVYRCFRTDCG